MNKKKILICGNYGVGNLGDEAILSGMIRIIQSSLPGAKIWTFTANINKTKTEQKVDGLEFFPAGARSFLRFWLGGKFWKTIGTTWKADLMILGGGGLFTDEKPRAIWIWLVQVLWWRFMGKKYVCYGQSIGPLKTKWARRTVGWIMNGAEQITVRDQISTNLLKEIGVNNKVEVLPDLSFAIGYDLAGLGKKRDMVVLSLREWIKGNKEKIYQELVQAILWLNQEYKLKAMFLPFQTDQGNDYDCGMEILNKLRAEDLKEDFSKIMTVSEKESVNSALEIISEAEMVIAMRLHANIFAAFTSTPMMAISYSQKVNGLMESIGMGEHVLKYEDFNFVEFKKLFTQIWDEKSEIRQNLIKEKMRNTYQVFEHEKLLKNLLD